ncbi:MAG: hypothetical protein HC842_09315 [Cytophagales bacterium]|nr:hypothetical protein [Cytophagales bacterium]
MVDLFPTGKRFYQRPLINPYGYLGLGITYYNPRTELNGQSYSLRQYRTEGVAYGAFTPVIPIGLGLKLKVTPFFNILFDGGYRFPFSDYLDDVSSVYPDLSNPAQTFEGSPDPAISAQLSFRQNEVGNGSKDPAAATGRVRGNPDSPDGYFIFNAKIEYYIPSLGGGAKRNTKVREGVGLLREEEGNSPQAYMAPFTFTRVGKGIATRERRIGNSSGMRYTSSVKTNFSIDHQKNGRESLN